MNKLPLRSKYLYRNNQKGGALIVSVMLFLGVSMVLLLGMVRPTVKQFQVTKNSQISRQSIATAESSLEDTVYRIKKGLAVGSTEQLTIGSSTAQTSVTDIGNDKKSIQTTGSLSDFFRALRVQVLASVELALPYAIEAGPGGAKYAVNNNGYITGNSISDGWFENGYTNDITNWGNIIATNQVTAVSAGGFESAGPTVTQAVGFGNTSNPKDFAQSFTPDTTGPIGQFELYMQGIGAGVSFTLETNNPATNRPSGTILSQGMLYSNCWFCGSYSWRGPTYSFYGQMTPTLYAGQKYWVVIQPNSSWWDNHNYIGAYTYSGSEETLVGNYTSGNWTAVSGVRGMYRLTYGGVNGVIGTTSHVASTIYGNVYSDTLLNTSVYGFGSAAYCNTSVRTYGGSVCSGSFNQSSHGFTITESMVSTWQTAATSGGVTSGSITISNNQIENYGPQKIEGDLTVNGTLNLTGPVWVTGNIVMGSNGKIKLNASFGDRDGVVITSGRFLGSHNNNVITGSGTYGSYVLVVSLSKCPSSCDTVGERAIAWRGTNGATWSNWWLPLPNPWVSGPVFFAPYGWVKLYGNSYSNFVAGDRVEIVDEARVRGNETPMIDMNFSSGKSVELWQETVPQ